jgi:FtsZ-interacting cell division protein ZipA
VTVRKMNSSKPAPARLTRGLKLKLTVMSWYYGLRAKWFGFLGWRPFAIIAGVVGTIGIVGAAIWASARKRDTFVGSIEKANARLKAQTEINREIIELGRIEAERRKRESAITQEQIAVTEKMAEISQMDSEHIAAEWNRLRAEDDTPALSNRRKRTELPTVDALRPTPPPFRKP